MWKNNDTNGTFKYISENGASGGASVKKSYDCPNGEDAKSADNGYWLTGGGGGAGGSTNSTMKGDGKDRYFLGWRKWRRCRWK